MHERRPQDRGDITGQTAGDVPGEDLFPDWDNPEDFEEGEPEGYYDDPDEDDDSYVPGPGDPDYDLSEAAGYAGYDSRRGGQIIPQWAIAAFCIVVIIAIVLGGLAAVW